MAEHEGDIDPKLASFFAEYGDDTARVAEIYINHPELFGAARTREPGQSVFRIIDMHADSSLIRPQVMPVSAPGKSTFQEAGERIRDSFGRLRKRIGAMLGRRGR